MATKVTEISSYLESLSAEELIGEIKKLHVLFPDVREYYRMQIDENGEQELLVKYKKIVKDEFFPDRGLGDARLSVARKAVADFFKLGASPLNGADIMIYYVEMGVLYTNTYGDIDESFYASMEKMYEKAAQYITERHLKDAFIDRFKKIVEDTEPTGWGFYDTLKEIFLDYFPDVPVREPK